MAYYYTIWRFFLDFLFPAHCVGCRHEGVFLCPNCFVKIPRQKKQVCPLCYCQTPEGNVCNECRRLRTDFALDGLLVVTSFEEKSFLQQAIHDLKYNFVKELAEPLGCLLTEVVGRRYLKSMILCPVPLHQKRLHWRGFNQAQLLAQFVSVNQNLPLYHLLMRKTFQKPQMELSREERLKNVTDAFCVDQKILTKISYFPDTVLLVDDVATTLSTLNACAKTLKKAGFKNVYGAVIARVY